MIDACAEAGLQVPHDVAVLGVDNDELLYSGTIPWNAPTGGGEPPFLFQHVAQLGSNLCLTHLGRFGNVQT